MSEPLDLDKIRQRVELTQRSPWINQRLVDLEALLAEVTRLRAAGQRVRALADSDPRLGKGFTPADIRAALDGGQS